MSGADPKRFAIIAATVYGNRGAQAMLETTIGRLRDLAPGSTFAVYSYYPGNDRALVTDPAVVVHSSTPAYLVLVLFPFSTLLALLRWIPGVARIFPASVRDLLRADALVDLAGVSFVDGREKYLPFNVLTILPAILLGTPVFKLSQALGPFVSAPNKMAARLLRRCALIVPRGKTTALHVAGLGLAHDQVLPAPDTAFAFETRDSLSDEGADEVAALLADVQALRERSVETVGICPSAVIASKARAQGWDYATFLADLAHRVLDSGRAVLLFPNATRAVAGKALRNNDLPVIAEVAALLEGRADADLRSRLLAVRGDVAAVGLRRLVEGCRCVAVSRFHAMIAALAAGVPVMVLGWSHKYAEVMEDFGLEEYVFDYTERDVETFAGRLDALCSDAEAVSTSIATRAGEVAAESARQFAAVIDVLERRR